MRQRRLVVVLRFLCLRELSPQIGELRRDALVVVVQFRCLLWSALFDRQSDGLLYLSGNRFQRWLYSTGSDRCGNTLFPIRSGLRQFGMRAIETLLQLREAGVALRQFPGLVGVQNQHSGPTAADDRLVDVREKCSKRVKVAGFDRVEL